MQGDWQDAIDRLQQVLAWRERLGRGDGPAALFDRAQVAYARCRIEPGTRTRLALREALAGCPGWSGWAAWRARAFATDCDAAVALARTGDMRAKGKSAGRPLVVQPTVLREALFVGWTRAARPAISLPADRAAEDSPALRVLQWARTPRLPWPSP